MVNDDLLNELRLQGGGGDFIFASNSNAMGEWFSFGYTLRTGSHFLANPDNLYDARYAEVRDTLHLQLGPRHRAKAGASLWRLDQLYKEQRYANGWMYYVDDTGTPYFYLYGVGSSRVDYDNDVLGVFLQDEWQVADNATVSLGLRYDLEDNGNNPGFEHPLAAGRSRDTDNIQPRLGFAWDVGGDGRTVLRGGAGRYVGRFPLIPALYELMFNGVTGRILMQNFDGRFLGLPDYPLDPADPEHTGVPVLSFVDLLADDLEAPESTQVSLGLARRLGSSGLSADLEWLYVEGEHETVYRDTNWRGNDDPCQLGPVPGLACRIDPSWGGVERYTSEGRSRYWAVTASLNGTLAGGHLIAASFRVSEKRNLGDEYAGLNYPSDPADLEAEWGRSRSDERYRLVLSGVFRLPWRLTVAPFFEYGSGQPWNRVLGYDANFDGWSGDRAPGVARNDQDGPPFRQLNLRLTKALPLGAGGELELMVEVFNLFNTTNFNVASVSNAQYLVVYDAQTGFQVLPNPDLGTSTATHPPREVQLGLRYWF